MGAFLHPTILRQADLCASERPWKKINTLCFSARAIDRENRSGGIYSDLRWGTTMAYPGNVQKELTEYTYVEW